jgi:hypothetical protein
MMCQRPEDYESRGELHRLLIKGDFIAKLPTEEGVYLLYACEGKYIETYTTPGSLELVSLKEVTNLDRLAEYADEAANRWRWRRSN